jgi:LCP family protein required for cell wall assembly
VAVFEERPPRPAFAVYKRAAVGALLILLSMAAAVSTAVLLQVKEVTDIIVHHGHRIRGIENVLDQVPAGKPQTILVLGADRRFVDIKTKNPVRSDTIMLVRLDPSKGATAVMSIPRDLKVQIPGRGTSKINEAYSLGGPPLTVRTVRQLLGIPINHVVNVNFGGFRRAVDRLGCVYVDIDRRYYHSNLGLAPSQQYAEINIKPGYQKLCGQKALDYVRYRHTDNDFIRSARQQDFLRQAKEQIGLGRLFGDRKQLLTIFAAYTDTDINSNTAILRLLKLAYESAKNPIQQIGFTAGDEHTAHGDYVVASPDQIRKTVGAFLNVTATKKKQGAAPPPAPPRPSDRKRARAQRRRATGAFPGLFNAGRGAEDQAVKLQLRHPGFPVYFPKLAKLGSTIVTDPDSPRVYTIRDRSDKPYKAYRMVVQAPGFGQYYGIQGTSWKAPPILDNPDEKRRMRGRDYQLFYDGHALRLVAWETPKAWYWVSNTLTESLTNKQMLGIARSLSRIGS